MEPRFPPPPWAAEVDLAAAVANGPPGEARDAARDWLGAVADLRRRHARHARPISDATANLLRRQGIPMAGLASLIALGAVLIAAIIHPAFWPHAALACAASGFLWFIALIARSDATVEDLRAQSAGRHCPFCRYDLAAVLPAVEGPPADDAGPARCTECGAAWPLLPPPAPLTGSTVGPEPMLPAIVRRAAP